MCTITCREVGHHPCTLRFKSKRQVHHEPAVYSVVTVQTCMFIWGSWKLLQQIIRKCLFGVIRCENVSLHKAASGNLRLDLSNDNYFVNCTASNLNCKIIFSQNKHQTNTQDSWWVSEDVLARKRKMQLMMMMMMMGMSLVLLIWSWTKVQGDLHIWSDGDARGEVSGSAEVNTVLCVGNIIGVSTKFHDISSNSLRDTSLWSKNAKVMLAAE